MSDIITAEQEQVIQAIEAYKKEYKDSFLPASFLLNLKGKPFTLRDHYTFEPMFSRILPRRTVYKCCRQVGKSNNASASRFLRNLLINYYNILMVCPRFEQIKRISNMYMKPLIFDSPFQELFLDDHVEQSILQRSFANGSMQFYSFAFLDAERIRSVSCNEIWLDEVQDIVWDFIPVIAETMSGSKRWRQQLYTGTPKTFENTIEKLWQESSMAEWVTKCDHCPKWNIACLDEDILQMIGEKTVVCASCGKPLNPRAGQWVHRFPDRRPRFAGYHISQITHPTHYESEENWMELIYKMNTYPKAKFYNECLGESWDSATRLMTQKILQDISVDENTNELEQAIAKAKTYPLVAMGIDWGGGGDESESYTAIALAGLSPNGEAIETFYVTRLNRNYMPDQEVASVLNMIKMFNPQLIAHDYGGAGYLRETALIQAGIPANKIVPYTYVFSASKNVITYNAAKSGNRSSYSIDKPRSLLILCTMMKAKKVLIPNFANTKDLLTDFLNLVEDRQERARGSDVYIVTKVPGTSDDLVHAMNYACSCIWYSRQKYPDIAEAMHIKLSQDEMNKISPAKPRWMGD